jgi:hypothetical protein
VLFWLGGTGGKVSGSRLVRLAAAHERVGVLEIYAYRVYESIGWDAGMHLVAILVGRGAVGELRRLSGLSGDATNVTDRQMAHALANAGELDRGLEMMRARFADDDSAPLTYVSLLAEHGRIGRGRSPPDRRRLQESVAG